MRLLGLLTPCFWIKRARDWATWRDEWVEATAEDYRVLEDMASGWRRDEEEWAA